MHTHTHTITQPCTQTHTFALARRGQIKLRASLLRHTHADAQVADERVSQERLSRPANVAPSYRQSLEVVGILLAYIHLLDALTIQVKVNFLVLLGRHQVVPLLHLDEL